MGFRDWAWRNLTEQGRAFTAYERGDLEWQTTLPVHNPAYRDRLREIEEVGWRQVERVDHPRVRTTDVTPRSDGGHDVTKTVTQDATFYFVRDDLPDDHDDSSDPQVEHRARWAESDVRRSGEMPARQPPPGWYPTGQGLRWWDGARWGPLHQPHPYTPRDFHTGAPTGMRPAEHVLHLFLTFITAGLWAPVWIFLSWRKRDRATAWRP